MAKNYFVKKVTLEGPDVGLQPTLLLLVYRLGHPHASRLSSTVQAHHLSLTAAFTQLADVLDRLSTFVDPVVLAGDVNIRLERATDPRTVEFCDLVTSYGLVQRARGMPVQHQLSQRRTIALCHRLTCFR